MAVAAETNRKDTSGIRNFAFEQKLAAADFPDEQFVSLAPGCEERAVAVESDTFEIGVSSSESPRFRACLVKVEDTYNLLICRGELRLSLQFTLEKMKRKDKGISLPSMTYGMMLLLGSSLKAYVISDFTILDS